MSPFEGKGRQVVVKIIFAFPGVRGMTGRTILIGEKLSCQFPFVYIFMAVNVRLSDVSEKLNHRGSLDNRHQYVTPPKEKPFRCG